jgi:enamine deaminase RidA (YjgF/YER057c/UK114 family)
MNLKRHEKGSILSPAVVHGDTVYLAGITAKDLSKDIKGQTRDIVGEIDRLLALCGSSKSKILQCQIWVCDIRYRAPMNEVWVEWVDKDNLPARAWSRSW